MTRPRVLLIDDDESFRRVAEHNLTRLGFDTTSAQDGESGLSALQAGTFDVVVTDVQMPGMSGLDVLREVKRFDRTIPVLIITAYGTIRNAVDAMQAGASDYITKPFNREELRLKIEQALKVRSLEEEVEELRIERDARFGFDAIVGRSAAMEEMFRQARKVARSDATVLILGESGTGKELLAKAIHLASPRKENPFVPVNCTAIPADLLESELFGHEKGAFTGATRSRIGKFEQADGGTLFLDEIGEMRMDLQTKLLRSLQEREIERVGGSASVQVDVRVIAATNRDLQKAIEENAFREDLYYRLSVIPLRLPPLRERREDVPFLVDHFLSKHSPDRTMRVDPEAMECLIAYDWPGNVRELENTIERMVVLSEEATISLDALPSEMVRPEARRYGGLGLTLPDRGFSLDELEKELIVAALEKHGGNQTRAAAYLGITRPTLIYRMEKYAIRQDSP